jgi:hypothetical protein
MFNSVKQYLYKASSFPNFSYLATLTNNFIEAPHILQLPLDEKEEGSSSSMGACKHWLGWFACFPFCKHPFFFS